MNSALPLLPSALRPSSTPATLRLILCGGWLVIGVLCVLVLCGWKQHESAVKTLGVDAAPSVVAAHHIKIYIETLDADLCNELLLPPSKAQEWTKDFDRARIDMGASLVAAAKNITYGDAELVPIRKIEESLGRYLMSAQSARNAHERGDDGGMLTSYQGCYRILKQELAPAADALNAANNGVLQSTYEAQKTGAMLSLFLMQATGILLIVLFAIAQVYLRNRFRRRFNTLLVAGTLLSALLVWYISSSFGANAGDMRGMKQDSYDSVLALLDARADSYEANAAESRWLLDRQNKEEHARTFDSFTTRLFSFSNGQTWQKCVDLGLKRNQLMAQQLKNGSGAVEAGSMARERFPFASFDGALRRALDNITFPDSDPAKDEPTQSVETLRTYGAYYDLDRRIRGLENSGQHAQAVAFCMSMKPGDSNWAFFQFDQALSRWLKINEAWMSQYTQRAFNDIANLQFIAPAVCGVLALLLYFGIKPRLDEYR